MKWLPDGPLLRVAMIGALILIVQIPSAAIGELARERQRSRDQATAEVFQTWGGQQQLAGPLLAVPYHVEALDKKGDRYTVESGTVLLLPEVLDVQARTDAEVLHRGLFDIPVYRTRLVLSGQFKPALPELGALVPRTSLQWDKAQLIVRLADVHGIERVGRVQFAGVAREFQGSAGLLSGPGLSALLPALAPASPAAFTIELDVRGSSSLHFAPTARETTVSMHSNWPHPKFMGSWLPDTREVTAQGFSARWKVTSVAGGLPSAGKRDEIADSLLSAMFGVELLNPVDPYRMSERTLKYDLLFIGLTFVVVWLFEQLTGRAVHPVQYLMLAASLCLFYLLELSLAEHFGFATAYAVAAMAVTAQVSFYARSILRGWVPALVLMVAVGSLYGLLYLLLQIEEYALLAGSTSLFVLLSAVMFLTRRIQWGRRAAVAAPAPAQ